MASLLRNVLSVWGISSSSLVSYKRKKITPDLLEGAVTKRTEQLSSKVPYNSEIISFFFLFFFVSFFLFFFHLFLGPHWQHMEVPRLEVKLELQLPTYAIATVQELSHIFDLHHRSRQHRILNPLSKARDQTLVLMGASQAR